MKKVTRAVIPAAGMGTRFLPATKAQPKEMLPIVDKPTIQYIVEEATQAGIRELLIVTGRNKRAVEDHFDRSVELEEILKAGGKSDLLQEVRAISELADIYYVRQKEPLGLGHAIYCARKFIGDEPFAVLLGDDLIHSEVPCLKQLLNAYEEKQCSILGVQEVPLQDVHRYGIVTPGPAEGDFTRVLDLVEKPSAAEAPSRLAVLGRYIIEPEIFAILENTPPGTGGEIQLTDALRSLLEQRPIYAYTFEGLRYDVGDKVGFLKATVDYALRRPDLAPEFRRHLEQIIEGAEK